MIRMSWNAKKFNKDLSKWDIDKVKCHTDFDYGSGIDDVNKLPKFKS